MDYLLHHQWKYGKIEKIGPGGYTLLIRDQRGNTIPQTLSTIAKPLTKSVEHQPHMMMWRKFLTSKDNAMLSDKRCDLLFNGKWYQATLIGEEPASNTLRLRYTINRYGGPNGNREEWVHRYFTVLIVFQFCELQ